MQSLLQREEYLLDFEEIENDVTVPISLLDLRRTINHFPRCHEIRIYLLLQANSMRVGEPYELYWHHILDNRTIVYRPGKQHYRRKRIIKISECFYQELMDFKKSAHFKDNKLFPGREKRRLQRQFNKKHRHAIGGKWSQERTGHNIGIIKDKYIYQFRSLRNMSGTLLFWYFLNVYRNADIALQCTAKRLKHSTTGITAQHYISRLKYLDLDKVPVLPYLQLMDMLIYGDIQQRLVPDKRQSHLIEF